MTFCDVKYSSEIIPHEQSLYKVLKVEACGLRRLGPNVGGWRKTASNGDTIFACFKSGAVGLKCILTEMVLLQHGFYTEPTLDHEFYTTKMSASWNYLLLAGGEHKSQPNIGRI